MPLTRDFRETIRERLRSDPGFREALLEEGVKCLLAGEVDVGKSVLRDYVNATIGFQELGGMTRKSPKSPDAHARSERQSPGAQPVRDHRLPSGVRGSASGGPGRSLTRHDGHVLTNVGGDVSDTPMHPVRPRPN